MAVTLKLALLLCAGLFSTVHSVQNSSSLISICTTDTDSTRCGIACQVHNVTGQHFKVSQRAEDCHEPLRISSHDFFKLPSGGYYISLMFWAPECLSCIRGIHFTTQVDNGFQYEYLAQFVPMKDEDKDRFQREVYVEFPLRNGDTLSKVRVSYRGSNQCTANDTVLEDTIPRYVAEAGYSKPRDDCKIYRMINYELVPSKISHKSFDSYHCDSFLCDKRGLLVGLAGLLLAVIGIGVMLWSVCVRGSTRLSAISVPPQGVSQLQSPASSTLVGEDMGQMYVCLHRRNAEEASIRSGSMIDRYLDDVDAAQRNPDALFDHHEQDQNAPLQVIHENEPPPPSTSQV